METQDTTMTFVVPDISCGHCKRAIEEAVRPLEGVHEADVDVEQRTVTVRLDHPERLATVVAAITDEGYTVPAATRDEE
ncbi:MAG: heavy metal-associated domain-containing protein [Thermoleophilia bacterium]